MDTGVEGGTSRSGHFSEQEGFHFKRGRREGRRRKKRPTNQSRGARERTDYKMKLLLLCLVTVGAFDGEEDMEWSFLEGKKVHPLRKAMIEEINSKKSTWTAAVNERFAYEAPGVSRTMNGVNFAEQSMAKAISLNRTFSECDTVIIKSADLQSFRTTTLR